MRTLLGILFLVLASIASAQGEKAEQQIRETLRALPEALKSQRYRNWL
jgi:hypothetical protein